MPKAIRIHEYGGPEVMRWEEVESGEPGPGQLRVRHGAIGLNYIDVYHRTGLYPMPRPIPRQIFGNCVLLPLPVAPLTMTT